MGQQNTRVEIGEVYDKTTHVVPKRTSRQSSMQQQQLPLPLLRRSALLHTYASSSAHRPSTRALQSRESGVFACEPAAGFIFLKEKASVAKHVHAGVEDLSVGGTADTGDEERQFVEETDDPAGWVVVC